MESAPADVLPEVIAQMGVIPAGTKSAIHIGESDLPFLDLGDGTQVQVLQIDLNQGLWVVRARFSPGYAITTHFHTGCVFAVTLKGSWYYKEQPEMVNTPGSYLFEPAGSVHTLTVPEDQEGETDVWFAVYGANINIDDDGNFLYVLDAGLLLRLYRAGCKAMGQSTEKMIVIGE